MRRSWLLPLFGLVAAVELVGVALDSTVLQWLAKPLLAPVLLAYLWARRRRVDAVAVGLVAATAGDVALLLPGDTAFLAGMGFFLVTQIAFITAFVRYRRAPVVAWAGYLLAWAGANALLWGMLGPLRVPVLGYSLALCLMAAAAAGVSRAGRRRWRVLPRLRPAHRRGRGRDRAARAGPAGDDHLLRGAAADHHRLGGRDPPGDRPAAAAGGYPARVARENGRKLIASNKKARHDYDILKTYEAGIVLAGTEVKSLREGRVSLVDAFAQERDGEIMLYGLHIAEYGFGTWTNHAPRRTRKLLLHRVEIARILEKLRDGGVTLVPLSMYFADGWAKVELGLARGRRSYDKRQALAERDAKREIAREMGRRLKGRTTGRRT